nr:MAG TPA: hypothetical protein [Bacteriophage sp.]
MSAANLQRLHLRRGAQTNCVVRKSLTHSGLAIFRVVVSPTLKTPNCLIYSYLRSTPRVLT